MKRLPPLLFALLLSLSACAAPDLIVLPDASSSLPPSSQNDTSSLPDNSLPDTSLPDTSIEKPQEIDLPDPDEYYYSLEDVVLYLDAYNTLPDNFISKADARKLGWSGGSVENYLDDAAIGGDRFSNREELLPKESGRTYTECDLNTHGSNSRGAERLVFSNDGLYFYTKDHYESFEQIWVQDGQVLSEQP